MTSATIVSCEGVCKGFNTGEARVEVIQNLDLCVMAGEKVAITGVSGCGKSTLLHLIGGLERPDAGQLSVCGRPLLGLGEPALCAMRNRHIGFVYQTHHLLPEFSVWENVAMPLMINGVGSRRCRQEADHLLKRAGLDKRKRHKPHELSGGERQRVAVCRSLIMRPDLVLADEPTGNLDYEMTQRIMDLMLEMEALSTLIMVTHNRDLTTRMDRHLEVARGRLTTGHAV